MPRKSIGLIETKGLAIGIAAADTAVKAANVDLLGYELSKGGGWTTIKIQGDVGSVKAAIDAAKSVALRENGYVSASVIARPSDSLQLMLHTADTIGCVQCQQKEEPRVPAEIPSVVEAEEIIDKEEPPVERVVETVAEAAEPEKTSAEEIVQPPVSSVPESKAEEIVDKEEPPVETVVETVVEAAEPEKTSAEEIVQPPVSSVPESKDVPKAGYKRRRTKKGK